MVMLIVDEVMHGDNRCITQQINVEPSKLKTVKDDTTKTVNKNTSFKIEFLFSAILVIHLILLLHKLPSE